MKKAFKFYLNQRVYLLGRAGMCVITGRGRCTFSSGGSLNMYQLIGGQITWVQEEAIISVEEAKKL